MEQIELEWELETPEGKSVFFDVTVNLLSPGRAGYVSGPPEKCYPPEPPELEIDSIKLQPIGDVRGVDGIDMPPVLWGMLGFTENECDKIYEKALELAADRAHGAYEDAMEAREEARREREWDERHNID